MTRSSSRQLTRLLLAWHQGEQEALDELLPAVYKELHQLAHCHLRKERRGHTLQTTALINEACLRLLDCKAINWQSRAHFFAFTSHLIRRILVDYARSHNYLKRGGREKRISIDENRIGADGRGFDIVALDDALKSLAAVDPRRSRVVELRYFGGLSVEETAEVLGVSPQTVLRDWRLAKAWLFAEISRTR